MRLSKAVHPGRSTGAPCRPTSPRPRVIPADPISRGPLLPCLPLEASPASTPALSAECMGCYRSTPSQPGAEGVRAETSVPTARAATTPRAASHRPAPRCASRGGSHGARSRAPPRGPRHEARAGGRDMRHKSMRRAALARDTKGGRSGTRWSGRETAGDEALWRWPTKQQCQRASRLTRAQKTSHAHASCLVSVLSHPRLCFGMSLHDATTDEGLPGVQLLATHPRTSARQKSRLRARGRRHSLRRQCFQATRRGAATTLSG